MSDGNETRAPKLQEEKDNKTTNERRKRKRVFDICVQNESQRNVNHTTSDDEETKFKKTKSSQFDQMYRKRQKTFDEMNTEQEKITLATPLNSVAGPSTSIFSKPAPKTGAERNKAYKERQKLRTSEAIATASVAGTSTSNFSKLAPKTGAERSKAYRERQKLRTSEAMTTTTSVAGPSTSSFSKPAPKTEAERCKAYRERQKLRTSEAMTTTVSKPPPKTRAEINKAYRERQKVKICKTITSTNTLNTPAVSNFNLLNPDHGAEQHIRLVTKEEAFCPEGIRLFFQNDHVDAYNKAVFSKCEDTIDSVARDILLGCGDNFERERAARLKFHQLSSIDTGGLPYHITFALKQPYMITTNIDVADGLANGAIGELVHVEKDDRNIEIIRLWIIFPKNVGVKARSKNGQYAQKLGISNQATPIGLRSATFPVYKNNKRLRTIQARRQHFPLKAACSMTIHKAQGETFDNVVYTYSRSYTQQSVYVALSRATSPEGLFIIPQNNKNILYHARRKALSIEDLRNELRRLSGVRLQTCDQKLLGKINFAEMTIFSFNCQSLKKRAQDLRSNVLKESDVLLLSETWLDNFQHGIENFLCVAKFKRAGGVAIYKNINKLQHVVTQHAEIYASNSDFICTHSSAVGDLCAAQCTMSNGRNIIIVSVYISPGKSITDIKDFLHYILLAYTEAGSKILNKKNHEIPMIIAGGFNVNFANEESLPLIHFLRDALNLEMVNGRTVSTTKHGTIIDAVFARFIDNLSPNIYVSHFSYHKPIVTTRDKNISIEESVM